MAHAGDGCAACATAQAAPPPPARTEWMLRAALAALGIGYVGAWVAAQYVDTQYFAVVVPALIGLACAWAATAAAGMATATRPPRMLMVIAAVTAGVAAALSDRLGAGGGEPFGSAWGCPPPLPPP